MNTRDAPIFRCTGRPGYSDAVRLEPGHVAARKLEREVSVRFSTEDCIVKTKEGQVHALPGDAIITGVAGEQWRVTRAHFPAKYRAVPPTVEGEDGVYVSIGIPILALEMKTAFHVQLFDGRSRLDGRPGDWLVDYGDGSLGIVSQAIFATTYEIQS